MKLKTVLVASLFYFIPATAGELGVCDLLLAGKKLESRLEFQLSDLETLYLEILSDSVRISNGNEKYVKDHAESHLKKKAEFLNDAMPIIRKMRAKKEISPEIQKQIELAGLMAASLGANLETITNLTAPPAAKIEDTKSDEKNAEAPVARNPIGFVTHANIDSSGPSRYVGIGNNERNTGSDLPEGLQRSIGFGPQTILSRVQTPDREFGKITIEMSEDQNTVVVTDLLTDTVYNVKRLFMFAGEADSEFKSMSIDYDSTEGEWILRYVNLANPDGKIGF